MSAGRTSAAEPARRIWLCADDYGISPAVSAAIRDLAERGRLNATSVMVVAPSFSAEEAAALRSLKDNGAPIAIGLHLTLTGPFRPLTSGFRPLRSGAFLPLGETLLRALARRLDTGAIAAESAAQIAAFEAAFGRPPDFVDGHQHVQVFPQFRDAVLGQVKALAPGAWLRQCGRTGPLAGRFADRKGLLLDLLSPTFRRRAHALGLRTNPAFAGTYDFRARTAFADRFAAFLAGLPDGSVVMCHPGRVDPELQRLDPLTDAREEEYAYFSGDEFPRTLTAQRVALA
ncbi:MAG TPA: ChbG/HpnK family deacetylase [Xanthobacteraceae bacterium]|nr:ChbG/HpnK family deacetylase [Xanthobacteraceae bacterium]